MAAALTPDATLLSPITAGLRFRGPAEIQEVLEAAYAVIDDGVQAELVAPGVLFVQGSVAGHRVEETILARPGADGRVAELRLFIRPLSGLITLTAALGPELARRRGQRGRALILRLMLAPVAPVLRAGDAFAARLLSR